MAESTLSPKYSDLRADIGWRLGYTRTSANWNTEQAAQIHDTLRSALRRFYGAHRWRFMEPTTELATVAPYATGTITVVDGVVTLSGGTFPSWAADGDLVVNAVAYSVNTRDSGTQITLDDLTVDVTAGSSYELARMAYTMPDGFGGITGPLYYVPENNRWRTVELINLGEILSRRMMGVRTGTVQAACVRPKAFDTAVGSRYEMLLWPMADAIYRLQFKYRLIPDDLTSDNYPIGGEIHGETLKLACLLTADELIDDGVNAQVTKTAYLESLARSIKFDSDLYSPDRMGYNGDSSDGPVCLGEHRGTQRGIRYNGTQYTGD